jgi:CheY-like chemotaxis protein
MRILVVDDDLESEDLRQLFKARLTVFRSGRKLDDKIIADILDARIKQNGFKLDFAFDGDKALMQYRQYGPYDLVLTDLYHPGIDGLDLARAILRENPEQPIAMFTACITPGPSLEAIWKLRIPVTDKLDSWEALSVLVEEARHRKSQRVVQ